MKILLVKLSSLGDVIQTMPVVHDILLAHPGAQIDWVVEEAFAPLVARVQGIRRVVPIAQRRWRKSRFAASIRREKSVFKSQLHTEAYDVVIDLQGLIKSALVARSARLAPGGFSATFGNASELCSYEWPVRFMLSRSYSLPKRIHAVARTRLLAAQALGYADTKGVVESSPSYGLAIQAQSTQPTLVFAHGTTRVDNEWPEANWLQLGKQLVAQGFGIVLPHAGAQELALATRLAQGIGVKAQVWPAMTLAQLLDHMAACAGVIGVDSGLSHMAVALGLPHVQIFSQPRVWRAGPVGQPHQVAVGGDAVPDVATVWAAWERVH